MEHFHSVVLNSSVYLAHVLRSQLTTNCHARNLELEIQIFSLFSQTLVLDQDYLEYLKQTNPLHEMVTSASADRRTFN